MIIAAILESFSKDLGQHKVQQLLVVHKVLQSGPGPAPASMTQLLTITTKPALLHSSTCTKLAMALLAIQEAADAYISSEDATFAHH